MSVVKGRNYRHLTAFILLVLAQKEMHGGAIHSTLCETLPNFNTDTGAVYRCLQELESDKAVESVWNTSEPGPAKKIYNITPLGWEELDKWEEDIRHRLGNLQYFLTTYKNLKKDKKT
ncbi:DNA-binding PadR family transcriptional regulator [Anaerobacterium chartisolvens]|uniref:DNA-binding PadR family transcriptional regulator n=1 Tax=Anaerobacterium chartisolvens TaxID=1297424 RepID=A0A369BEL1_9FIRM|nr:helix-turn-helix transcriptional regulator [Anaerobacterium chartisolvens]RCX18917.1 DNA-binding PadR family transcriptional regulator [Anaerobacterium chartisolvens]